MSETNKLYDEMMLDSRHAQRENVFMSQGQPLYKIDPNGQPPVDPNTGMPQMDQMGMPMPAYKQATQTDPMTGQDIIDPTTGAPKQYPVTVNPFDAHDIHIEEHQNYQKSQEYELLPPEVQQIIQDHVDEHKMEMLKERNAIQADAAAKGENPQEPSPEGTPPPRELPTDSSAYGGQAPSPNGNGQLA